MQKSGKGNQGDRFIHEGWNSPHAVQQVHHWVEDKVRDSSSPKLLKDR